MSVTSKERLKLTSQGQRLTIQHQQLKCSQLEEKLHQMEIELKKSSINVDDQLSDDFINIFGQNSKNVTPFMNLFWQQQVKLFSSSPKGH